MPVVSPLTILFCLGIAHQHSSCLAVLILLRACLHCTFFFLSFPFFSPTTLEPVRNAPGWCEHSLRTVFPTVSCSFSFPSLVLVRSLTLCSLLLTPSLELLRCLVFSYFSPFKLLSCVVSSRHEDVTLFFVAEGDVMALYR